MFGGTLTECICAVVSGILLLIALPNMIAKKMHAGTWSAFFAALALDAYIALAEHFSDNLRATSCDHQNEITKLYDLI